MKFKVKKKLEKTLIKLQILCSSNKGQAFAEMFIGVAICAGLAAYVVVPGFNSFANNMFTKLNSWWTGISSSIFTSS